MSVFLCRTARVEGIVMTMRENCYLLSGIVKMRLKQEIYFPECTKLLILT